MQLCTPESLRLDPAMVGKDKLEALFREMAAERHKQVHTPPTPPPPPPRPQQPSATPPEAGEGEEIVPFAEQRDEALRQLREERQEKDNLKKELGEVERKLEKALEQMEEMKGKIQELTNANDSLTTKVASLEEAQAEGWRLPHPHPRAVPQPATEVLPQEGEVEEGEKGEEDGEEVQACRHPPPPPPAPAAMSQHHHQPVTENLSDSPRPSTAQSRVDQVERSPLPSRRNLQHTPPSGPITPPPPPQPTGGVREEEVEEQPILPPSPQQEEPPAPPAERPQEGEDPPALPDMQKCQYCNKQFRSRQGRRSHEAQKHLGVVNHSCAVCHKGFYLLADLKRHCKVYRHRLK